MSDKLHNDLIKRISFNAKRLRAGRGLTQEDMSEHGFNVRHYQRIESGIVAINTRTLAKLCAAFKVDALELFKAVKKN